MKTLRLLALTLLLGQPAGADTPPRYRLTVLPLTFSGYNEVDADSWGGSGINAQGQIVGMASVKSGRFRDDRAALWQRGHPLRVLDKRPITDPNATSGQDFVYPTAINTRGKTTATHTVSCSGAYTIQFSTACLLWNGRVNWFSQGFPSDPDTSSAAFGLNDKGDVVGSFVYDDTAADAPTNSHPPPGTEGRQAFLRRGGRILPLWWGVARGVNNQDWIIGAKDTDGSSRHARGVLWRNGKMTLFQMQPAAINERGEIAGNVPISDDRGTACLWRQGKITHLSRQTSHAYALNNLGDVVGEQNHAALWRDGRSYDLNRCASLPKGWVLEKALGINEHGWIIGKGSIYKTPKNTQAVKSFTFLLTPQ